MTTGDVVIWYEQVITKDLAGWCPSVDIIIEGVLLAAVVRTKYGGTYHRCDD